MVLDLMVSPVSGGMVDYRGGCDTCGQTWESRNVMGIAAKHADKYDNHDIWVETGFAYRWGPWARARLAEQRAEAAARSA